MFLACSLLFQNQTEASKAECEQHSYIETVASRHPPGLVTPGPSGKTGALLGSLTTPINNEKHERLASAIQHALAFGRTDDKGFGAVLPSESARRIASGLMNAPRATPIDAPSVCIKRTATFQISCGLLRNGKRDFEKAKTIL